MILCHMSIALGTGCKNSLTRPTNMILTFCALHVLAAAMFFDSHETFWAEISIKTITVQPFLKPIFVNLLLFFVHCTGLACMVLYMASTTYGCLTKVTNKPAALSFLADFIDHLAVRCNAVFCFVWILCYITRHGCIDQGL